MSHRDDYVLLAFLANRGPDARGRNVHDVLAFSDTELEYSHDFIQWLFPLPIPSRAQPGSPVLRDGEADAIRRDADAKENLRSGAEMMLGFYERTRHWLSWSDHNHLRISRILQSLRLICEDDEARRFYERIGAIHHAAGSPINPASLQYWHNALQR